MSISPFGFLTEAQKTITTGLMTPMYEWSGTMDEFSELMSDWLRQIETFIWPRWDDQHGWQGNSTKFYEKMTKAELELAVRLYHGEGDQTDILDEYPDIPWPSDNKPRNHRWHYRVEDAWNLDVRYKYSDPEKAEDPTLDFIASDGGAGSNFPLYLPNVDKEKFMRLFWGRMRGIQPALFDIKYHFQRPRPWSTAKQMNVRGFRWEMADGFIHTGLHPSILSGHSVQGILAGCSVFEALLDESRSTGQGLSYDYIAALQKYMVEYGDRRVFAGVHYITDNIASWTLARRLIPRLFRNGESVLNFATMAIIRHSRVCDDILQHLPDDFPPKMMLLDSFPELIEPGFQTRSR